MRNVVIPIYPGVELIDVAGPTNVFTAASRLLDDDKGYSVKLIGEKSGAICSEGGLELVAPCSAASFKKDIDILLIPGGGATAASLSEQYLKSLLELSKKAKRVASVCSGALILARLGLLNNKAATTHWAAADELRRLAPDCRVDDDSIYVCDGNIWTSAGATAGIDLALAIVENDYNAKLSLEIAKWLVVYMRRSGGQSQYSTTLAAQSTKRKPIEKSVEWIRENLDADLTVSKMAEQACMSERSFARVFVTETGYSPAHYVTRLRLEAARTALETTDEPVKRIVRKCGFGTVETMNRVFRRMLDTTPLQYRKHFQVHRN